MPFMGMLPKESEEEQATTRLLLEHRTTQNMTVQHLIQIADAIYEHAAKGSEEGESDHTPPLRA